MEVENRRPTDPIVIFPRVRLDCWTGTHWQPAFPPDIAVPDLEPLSVQPGARDVLLRADLAPLGLAPGWFRVKDGEGDDPSRRRTVELLPAGRCGAPGGGRVRRMAEPVDLAAVLATFDEPWSPRTVALMNDYDVRVVKTLGAFTRHAHPDTDELFLVMRGSLTIEMDGGDVELGPGQLYVVPRGVPHRPVSVDGADVVLIEPSTTVNTGDTPSHLTAQRRSA